MSYLPIDPSSPPLYGSKDGGRKVYNESEDLARYVCVLCVGERTPLAHHTHSHTHKQTNTHTHTHNTHTHTHLHTYVISLMGYAGERLNLRYHLAGIRGQVEMVE